MNGNRLGGGITSVELDAQRFEKGNVPSYSLIVIYSGPTFINIDPGESLILIVDGKRYEFQGNGSDQNKNIISIGVIEEKAYYHDLEPDFFRILAYAKEVEVEVHATRNIMNRHFKKNNFTNFKEFYNLYVKDQTGLLPMEEHY